MARSSSSDKGRKRTPDETVRTVALTPSEVEIIRKACMKYRQTIPIYIESRRQEAVDIDSVLKKLK